MKLYFVTLLLVCVSVQGHAALSSPNISANSLFLFRQSNYAREDAATERNGLDVQEAEIAFYADVDPYSSLKILLAVHPEYELVGSEIEQSWVVEPEELFAEVTHIPQTTLKVGKFKTAFGKHNLLHTHAFPLVEAPLANTTLLGEEGLNDIGLSAAVLLPTPWFSELTAQYLRGAGESTAFNSPTPGDAVGLAHWKNLWELSEAMTFEAGVSYAKGDNAVKSNTTLLGADLTLKWRPTAGGKYKSWILASEFIQRSLGQSGAAEDEEGTGWNVWGKYQFAERWAAIGRFDFLDVKGAADSTINANALDNETVRKYSAGLVLNATEFSSYRLEASYGKGAAGPDGETIERKILLQASFTIGAHPSHEY